MTDEPKDEFPVDRKSLLEPPENFRVLLDIDGKQFGAALTAFNRKSMIALAQFILIVNPRRVTGYVIRTESAIIGGAGELVAAVPGGSFISQMVAHSRLKDPAPKEPPSVDLPFWNTFQVKPKDQTMPDNSKKFIAEVVIDGVAEKFPVTGANEDSVIALFTAATCSQMPRINGWNLYNAEDGKMIASVPAMLFLAKLAEISPLGKTPADPKSVGWRALPAIAPTSEEFQKSIEAAKKAGKTST